jgi:hypothetical protein
VKNARDGMRRASKEMRIVGVIRMRSAGGGLRRVKDMK